MSHRRLGWTVLLVLLLGHPAHAGGIGILGDSYSDEYQFYGPDRAMARNWVEFLSRARGLNFGEFSDATRGEPRNQGFAYNWARSNATSDDLIASGQHTGLAEQAARGEVSIAVVFIGGNDAIHALNSPATAMDGLGRRAAENVETAVKTLLDASPDLCVLVVTVPDVRDLPEFRDRLRSGSLDRRAADAAAAELRVLNAHIRKMPRSSRRVAVLDFDRVSRISNYVVPRVIPVGGLHVDRSSPGNAIDHLFLEDLRHLGTIGQGMFAKMVIETLNAHFDTRIAPLDDLEIIAFARSLSPSMAARNEPAVIETSFTEVRNGGQ